MDLARAHVLVPEARADHQRPERADDEEDAGAAEQPIGEPSLPGARRVLGDGQRLDVTLARRSRSPEVPWWTAWLWRQLANGWKTSSPVNRPTQRFWTLGRHERAVRAVVEDDEGAQQETGGRDREQPASARGDHRPAGTCRPSARRRRPPRSKGRRSTAGPMPARNPRPLGQYARAFTSPSCRESAMSFKNLRVMCLDKTPTREGSRPLHLYGAR